MQHRRERVLSLTTSLVTPLNFVIVAFGSVCIKSLVDESKDISIDWPAPVLIPPTPLHKLFVDVILCGAPISDPFSDIVALFRDCARCFFKLARVVPACDWSTLWVSNSYHIFFFCKKTVIRWGGTQVSFIYKWIARLSVCVFLYIEPF